MSGARSTRKPRRFKVATARRWATAVALGTITVVLVVLLVQLSQRFAHLRQSPTENFQWMAYQIGKDYDRLQLAVRVDEQNIEAVARNVLIRFDILMSRFDLLNAPAFSNIDDIERVDAINARLLRIDSLLSKSDDIDRDTLERLDSELSEGRKSVDKLILSVLHHVGESADAHNSDMERTLTYSVATFSLLCIALLVTLMLVLRQSGRLEKRERQLNETTRTLSDAQRIARLGSLSYDTFSKRLDCSSELRNICAVPFGEPLSMRGLMRFVHPEDRASLFAMLREGLKQGEERALQSQDFELRLLVNADCVSHVRGSLECRHTGSKERTRIIATLQDVTREVASVRALEAARDEADRANDAKSEFLAMMSHELRTPMNGVLGMLDALQDSHLTKQQDDLVSVAYKSAQALLVILNDILDMSKIEAGKLELESATFELGSMIGVVGSLYRQQAADKHITVDWSIAPDCPKWLVGDGIRLRQVLLNLVSNAIKFTEVGGVQIDVRQIACGGDGGSTVRFSIRDSGIGIPDEKRAHVFTPFDQLDRSYTRRFGGTGLGLAICKSLIELMNGTIDFESTPGYGTAFWCDIPFQVALAPCEPAGGLVKKAQRALEILVAEDDATNQLVARHILQTLGHQATIVGNGRLAVEAAEAKRYDAILMDISLPEIDGVEATARIRRSGGLSSTVPIFAVSAHTMRADIETCLEAGMNDFVSKPIDRAKLASLLSEIEAPDDVPVLTHSNHVTGETGTTTGPAPSRFSRIQTLESELGPDILSGVLEACASDLKRAHALTLEAVRSGDQQAVRKAAHSIRGVAAMVGDDDLVDEATALLENRVETGNDLETKTRTAIEKLLDLTAA